MFPRCEARWKVRSVLQRLELRFGKRIVVGDVRPRTGFVDDEVREQQRDRLRQRESARADDLCARAALRACARSATLSSAPHQADRTTAASTSSSSSSPAAPSTRAHRPRAPIPSIRGPRSVAPARQGVGLCRRRGRSHHRDLICYAVNRIPSRSGERLPAETLDRSPRMHLNFPTSRRPPSRAPLSGIGRSTAPGRPSADT